MPPATAKAPARKRNRKRKRRAASTSSSDSSSELEESSDASTKTPLPSKPIQAQPEASSESSSGSSSSEPESEPEGSSLVPPGKPPLRSTQPRRVSPSPSPPPAKLPSFLPETNTGEVDATAPEQLMKDKFRKFWMASIADGFRDDLEEIRKEPKLGPSRLSLLIDSLASGADVFSSSRSGKSAIDEVEVILE